MFRFHKTLDIVTLFHKANSPASTRIVNLLKTASANASQAANEATNSTPAKAREPFELNITEEPPTEDQVKTILEYIGPAEIPHVVKGANNVTEALKRFKQDRNSFQRPLVVDWNNGKAVVGENESEILKMLESVKR
ncbi:hypothetical protein SAPIO_CDS5120 [Scedosporium apiospermum]|uniref:Uncharacterized protein n=1 Tax=Pseudallescheria apiosperma TaxID=563466 RepID=A0A084G6T1_PSEDA|nr:uncharacterized protein SAPIO_CDS5120 [Scedosporium apiospermum]KEZ43043.1 hypothetical protein SAPIO_CDS5120 [Scedosporium apiospermum]